jgi:hypothetical protein
MLGGAVNRRPQEAGRREDITGPSSGRQWLVEGRTVAQRSDKAPYRQLRAWGDPPK